MRRPLGRGLGLALALAALPTFAVHQRAHGAPVGAPPETRSVVVWPPVCKSDKFPLASFLDCLRVELAGRGLDCCTLAHPDEPAPTVGSVWVQVQVDPCTDDADRLQIQAREAAGTRMAERQITLSDVPEPSRPRAMALAVAELIRSLGQGPPDKAPETVTAPAKTLIPSPGAPPAAASWPTRLSLHAEAEVRDVPTRNTALWGGRVRVTAHRKSFHADLDLGGSGARAQSPLGDVVFRSATVGIGFGPRMASRIAVLDLGLRAEVGWAWTRGESTQTGVRTGAGSDWIAMVGLRASLEVPAQLRARPNLTVEGGAVVRGLKGDANGAPVAGMSGIYLLAALGIAVSL